jgi:hypothetical protein
MQNGDPKKNSDLGNFGMRSDEARDSQQNSNYEQSRWMLVECQ